MSHDVPSRYRYDGGQDNEKNHQPKLGCIGIRTHDGRIWFFVCHFFLIINWIKVRRILVVKEGENQRPIAEGRAGN